LVKNASQKSAKTTHSRAPRTKARSPATEKKVASMSTRARGAQVCRNHGHRANPAIAAAIAREWPKRRASPNTTARMPAVARIDRRRGTQSVGPSQRWNGQTRRGKTGG
jgi:hypothetical protein